MALHLLSSNRFETLRDALLANLALPGRSPFVPDRIIVPSLGVRRSIELGAARTLGICANVEFPFLAQWLWGEIAKVVPGVDPVSPFAPNRLAWRIYRILGEASFVAGHAALARYLAGNDALLRYDLAVRIAQLFDHYITYRRDWLDAWARGRAVREDGGAAAFAHEPWQADLWRRLAAELGAARQHPAEAFFAAIGDGRRTHVAPRCRDAPMSFASPASRRCTPTCCASSPPGPSSTSTSSIPARPTGTTSSRRAAWPSSRSAGAPISTRWATASWPSGARRRGPTCR